MVNSLDEFLFSEEKKCDRNIMLYFILCSSTSVICILGIDNPSEFFRIIKMPINDKTNFPLFLLLGFIILSMFGCYYAIKKCSKNNEVEKDGYWTEIDLYDSNEKTRIDGDPLYEIDEEERTSTYSI